MRLVISICPYVCFFPLELCNQLTFGCDFYVSSAYPMGRQCHYVFDLSYCLCACICACPGRGILRRACCRLLVLMCIWVMTIACRGLMSNVRFTISQDSNAVVLALILRWGQFAFLLYVTVYFLLHFDKKLIKDVIYFYRSCCYSYMFLKKILFWFVCLAKDPFYMQLTRDTYRRMFGSPEDKASYARVIIFFQLFLLHILHWYKYCISL